MRSVFEIFAQNICHNYLRDPRIQPILGPHVLHTKTYSLCLAGRHRSYEPHTGSDSDDDILRRLRVQQTSSLHSGISGLASHPLLANYGGGGTTTPAAALAAPLAAAQAQATEASAAEAQAATASEYAARQQMIRIPHIQQRRLGETCNDPLGVAERGKVGLPPSSSECSSNSSSVVDASVDCNTGLISSGLKKGIVARIPFQSVFYNSFGVFVYLAADRRVLELAAARSFDSKAAALRETRIDRIEQRRHIERRNSTNSAATAASSGKYRKIGTSLLRQDSLDDVPDLNNSNQDVSIY